MEASEVSDLGFGAYEKAGDSSLCHFRLGRLGSTSKFRLGEPARWSQFIQLAPTFCSSVKRRPKS